MTNDESTRMASELDVARDAVRTLRRAVAEQGHSSPPVEPEFAWEDGILYELIRTSSGRTSYRFQVLYELTPREQSALRRAT